MGTAAVHDLCTSVGPELINPIITLAPGELSTWNPTGIDADSYTAGEIWEDPSAIPDEDDPDAFEDGIAALELQDLACPKFGLGRSTSADGTVITTVGPPWLPLVVPPMNMFSLDPIWAALCTGVLGDSWGQTAFALFDPPIALTPASLLVPTPKTRPTPTPVPIPAGPTTVPERATPSTEAAKPASLPNDPVSPPVRTGEPAVILPPNSIASPQNKGDPSSDPPSDPPTDPKVYPISTSAGDPLAGSPVPSSSTRDPPSDNPDIPPTDPKVPVVPLPGEDAQPQSHGLGAIIYNAFGKSGPEVDGSSTVSLPPQSIFTIGDHTFTVNPAGFEIDTAAIAPGGNAHIVDGTTISLEQSGLLAIDSSAFQIDGTIVSEGGPAATVDGTIISLGQSGALAIGSSTVHLPTLSDTSSNIYTVAGQIFTPNPSAFQIAGTTVSEGGPAATVDGTIISLGQSGALAIGSSIFHLPTLSDTPSNAYTVAGQRFTPNPSAFTIAGTVISAGGPAAVMNGTTVSLEPSGTLLVGSSTIPLLSSPGSRETNIDGFDVKVQSSFVIVDGTTLSAAAAGVTISGKVFSLEAGGSSLDIGTGRFALPTQVAANGSVNVQAFTGGQSKRLEMSLTLICGGCGLVMLLFVFDAPMRIQSSL